MGSAVWKEKSSALPLHRNLLPKLYLKLSSFSPSTSNHMKIPSSLYKAHIQIYNEQGKRKLNYQITPLIYSPSSSNSPNKWEHFMSITNTFNVNIARIKDISVKEHKKQQINESFLYSLILFTILQLFLTALILSSYVESIIISWNCSITLWSGWDVV